jgi:lipopolysaccharide/colanic/teichoic acid biosynthesis glycosyltransferase
MQAEYQSPSRGQRLSKVLMHVPGVDRSLIERPPAGRQFSVRALSLQVIKRCVDVSLVVISMPLILLLLGAVASGDVELARSGFYSHRRIRKNGAFFSIGSSVRCGVNSAEVLEDYLHGILRRTPSGNETHKLRRDPRITRLGGFLRRYSLMSYPSFGMSWWGR